MQPRWRTLTWQERGGWFLPMMLTHQRRDCGNFSPELIASLSSHGCTCCCFVNLAAKRRHVFGAQISEHPIFLEMSCPRRDFQWDLMKCCAWNQQRASFNITPAFDIMWAHRPLPPQFLLTVFCFHLSGKACLCPLFHRNSSAFI